MTAREALERIKTRAGDIGEAIRIADEALRTIPPELDAEELGDALKALEQQGVSPRVGVVQTLQMQLEARREGARDLG